MPRDKDGQLVSEAATNDRCPYCGTDADLLDVPVGEHVLVCDKRPKRRLGA
jgi:ssDNA-binding Zn-finger/Zn-ribbon topoisomerase 1